LGRTIVVHSYRGGTGKTIVAANTAYLLAARGKYVCILDYDLCAPALHRVFGVENVRAWLNDFFAGQCGVADVLNDLNKQLGIEGGRLCAGFANPDGQAIKEMLRLSMDQEWCSRNFQDLLRLRSYVLEDLNYDFLIIDTMPGYQLLSMNALAIADDVVVVTVLDRSDIEGTLGLLEAVYRILQKQPRVIINKAPVGLGEVGKRIETVRRVFRQRLKLEVLGVIPCSCDIPLMFGERLIAHTMPEHHVVRALEQVVKALLKE